MDHYALTQDLATAGTLHHIIQSEVGIPEDAVKRCAKQISSALDYMHGEPVAVKLLKKDRTLLKTFLKELSLSISLSDHPHIIKTYPIFIGTMDHYALTQELAMAGTLHHIIQSEVGIPEDAVKRCAKQISSALDYMHGRGLVHRDLKPDNVLLMDKDCYQIKLSDFGLTQPMGNYVSSMSHIIPYMSPELCDLKGGEYLILSPTIDIWAFGVLLFVVLTGFFPWIEATESDTMYQVYINWRQSADFTSPPFCWQMLSREAIYMFDNLFAQCPFSRQSVLSIFNYLNFPWKIKVFEY
ncbi:serine/threonine-protein kinase SBK1-like [Phyllobates terribilis]|uniref:serine/threonine-protein kinase SBK1-like n=1 Tax=Phyllobates terribilis TaxID=111132 RepID=UPI003CCB4F29